MDDPASAADAHLQAPLASLGGKRPPAPAWFSRALGVEPERSRLPVEGAEIEVLTWGERGRPGLLFLHGSAAHADWWSFIAPFFSAQHRIAALSWSGMGGSDWRERYGIDLFVEEALAVAEAAGLFEGGPPVIVAHSFGGFPTLAIAGSETGGRLGGAIIVDTPIWSPERRRKRESERREKRESVKTHRVYPTVPAALARFRYAPVQPCANLFITDHIARGSIREVPAGEGVPGGYTWRFDPSLWSGFERRDPRSGVEAPRCRIALVDGDRSTVMDEGDHAYRRSILAPGTPVVTIPESGHHVMADQPLALVAVLRTLLAQWRG